MNTMTPEVWAERIRRGQAAAVEKYGHLSVEELDRVARPWLIPRYVYEYLRARALGRESPARASVAPPAPL